MFSNTGTISFVLYGIFVVLTIVAMIVAFYFIKKGNIEEVKLEKMISLFKYSIVSVAIATVSLVVSDLFREREQDVKELEYFDKYVEDVKKADGIQERYQLSKYLSIVAPSGELKDSWREYYDTVKIEYQEYLNLLKEKKKLDTIKNPNEEEQRQKENLNDEINKKEAPLVSYRKSTLNDLSAAEHYEMLGFNYLLEKDVINAINSFVKSENAYNEYHQVYEISKYLRNHKIELLRNYPEAWKITYQKIVSVYSYGMPTNIKDKLIDILN